jgi:23S rRNA (adenine1618-N6)-methyltransferase
LNDTLEKNNLHPRNPHRFRYNFKDLINACPELAPFVLVNKYESEAIDFANPEAVKMLNRAILMYFYEIKHWDIPTGYLCPPVPGRADYIHYAADLLAETYNGKIPKGNQINIMDIGVGANCIYPIIGVNQFDWHFVGTDIDPVAIKAAENIITANELLEGKIECRLQSNSSNILDEVIGNDERFDLIICNPPFHSSAEEAMEGNRRKQNNLADKSVKFINKEDYKLNFGGQSNELWCEGGEKAFIVKMVKESTKYKNQVLWFSSLVSNKSHLKSIENALKNAKVAKMKTIEMAQGQKISRFIAWTFQNKTQQAEWAKSRWK